MWHYYDKEKPQHSGKYVTISKSGHIGDLPWSNKHQCFNANDDDVNACFAIRNIFVWAYFDDICPIEQPFIGTLNYHERGRR